MICGIDFGTSNTLSTVFDGGKERLITLENNAFSTPGAVFSNHQRLNRKSVLTYDLIKESTKHCMGDLIDV